MDRVIFEISGSDAHRFLQDLVTNDLKGTQNGLVYAALLSPQGKYLFDFFLFERNGTVHLDIQSDRAAALQSRLTLYKLRADVTIKATELCVTCATTPPPANALPDPRHPALGWLLYDDIQHDTPATDWDQIRVTHCIPQTGVELIPDDTYILEAGFERLNGVDFKKGCYVGQEVTARMKHKTELRKGFATVNIEGTAPVGTDITANGKTIGKLFTQSGGKAIAYLRFDRTTEAMRAGRAVITYTSSLS